jgi:metal-dependent amidase/aminoacylase/carboxypeptidase family protein
MHENQQLPAVAQVEQDDQWLDEVLSQTFPASDPVPWRHRETATNAGVRAAVIAEEARLDGETRLVS